MSNDKAPVLVATDGTAGSLAAVRMAQRICEQHRCEVIALGVVEPVLIPGEGWSYSLLMSQPDLERAQHDQLRSRITDQLAEVGADAERWSVQVDFGSPAPTLVRHAAEAGARLIVLGLGRHEAADRWLGTETALKATHLAHVPVLAVHPHAEAPARRALLAVDFSDFSRDAARTAIELVAENAELHLAHVSWTAPTGADSPRELAWAETYRVGARTRLEDMRRELMALNGRLRCVSTVLEGETARALLKYARMSSAEMIVTGSHGYGFLGRMMMGSVSTRILRQAHCSVLIAPPRTVVVEPLNDTAAAGRERPVPAAAAV